jgi:hypothetical protein
MLAGCRASITPKRTEYAQGKGKSKFKIQNAESKIVTSSF